MSWLHGHLLGWAANEGILRTRWLAKRWQTELQKSWCLATRRVGGSLVIHLSRMCHVNGQGRPPLSQTSVTAPHELTENTLAVSAGQLPCWA